MAALPVWIRLGDMDSNALMRMATEQEAIVAELAASQRVRELANFLGLDAESVAEGLVEAVQRDVTGAGETLQPHLDS